MDLVIFWMFLMDFKRRETARNQANQAYFQDIATVCLLLVLTIFQSSHTANLPRGTAEKNIN